jgi:hypothetical protein
MISRGLPLGWLQKVQWRACGMWVGAVGFGEAAAAVFGPQLGFIATGLAILVSAGAGALGGAAIFDALSPLLPRLTGTARAREQRARDGTLEPSSAWQFDYLEADPDETWSSDHGRSQVAWAEATLAARDAWERAARNSRTRVVMGKRVFLGDPPPRSGDDT